MAVVPTKKALGIKKGNYLSNEHWNLSFGLLGPEKYAFKDCNPTYKIMIKKNILKFKFLGGVSEFSNQS